MDIWPQDLGSESTFGKFLKLTFRGEVAVVQRLARDTSWPNINNWRILIQASEDVSWTSDPTPVYQLWPINSITTVWSDRRSLSKFLEHISSSSNISRRRCAPRLFASLTNSLSESVCWGVRVSRFGVAQCHTLSSVTVDGLTDGVGVSQSDCGGPMEALESGRHSCHREWLKLLGISRALPLWPTLLEL